MRSIQESNTLTGHLTDQTYMPIFTHMPKFEQADLVTSADAARILGVHVATVARRVASGSLRPAMKLPGETGAYLFDRAQVERIAAERAAS